jgi:phosphoribosyl-AMP cyclohydrolase
MPQLKHYYVILQTAKLTTDDVRITNYMPNYAAQMQLNTFTVHFFSDNLSLQRLTYYKGDISATQSCDYSFGF